MLRSICAAVLFLPLVAAAAPPAATTTAADQTAVAVTVYNDGLGLVKDRRTITLEKGAGELRFMDVAARLIPASVQIRALEDHRSLRILEQNYEYDLLSREKLLEKYVGKEVLLQEKNPYTEREETVTATLLANNNGPVFKIGDRISFDHPGRIIFPSLPEDLLARPTLVWLLENDRAAPRPLEVSYLTNGIGWRADYVLTLAAGDDRADLAGWVTIDNKSGATYRNATLKLVAGSVNRVREEQQLRFKGAMMAEAAATAMQEESFFDYHLYTLPRPTTIKENQTKQIALLSATEIPVRKEYLLRGQEHLFTGSYPQPPQKERVQVYLEMENRTSSRLGMPFPKGIIRVYRDDAGGSLQFVGEDTVDHTPRDERIRVRTGDAFDLVAERRQTEWKKVAADTYESAMEIVLRNHTDQGVTIRAVEPVPGDWQVLSASHKWEKGEGRALVFSPTLAARGETVLSYRVRIRH
jgi:hypothetical protein